MAKSEAAVRKRGDAEQTRRRVLDAAIATVVDVGYYKASSNEIARRAGVTWGSIQHLFGSREQLMLDVVNDIGVRLEESFAAATVEGDGTPLAVRVGLHTGPVVVSALGGEGRSETLALGDVPNGWDVSRLHVTSRPPAAARVPRCG